MQRNAFRAIGTTVELVVTDPRVERDALQLLRIRLAELDAAASRFRPDSELSAVNAAARRRTQRTQVGATLAGALTAAWRTSALTGGLVTPTVGRALIAAGYDADLDVVRARGSGPSPVTVPRPDEPGSADWTFDPLHRELTVDAGVQLDLGASAKAWAADSIAAELATTMDGGFLVNLGGDVATSGSLPDTGWSIGVADHHGAVLQRVRGAGQAFATSSTRLRTWQQGDVLRHHIIDPRTGSPADTIWSQVTCAAVDTVEANAASTASIILGADAPGWLASAGVAARLDAIDGSLRWTPGWADPTREPITPEVRGQADAAVA